MDQSSSHSNNSESVNNEYDAFQHNSHNCLHDNVSNSNYTSSSPLIQQQYINNNINESTSPILDHDQSQYVQNIPSSYNNLYHVNSSNTTINSQPNYTELFKIEISGIEIVIRKKSSLNFDHNLEMQQSNQRSTLTNRIGRVQNRMHPYHHHNKINSRNSNAVVDVIPKQQHTCSCFSAAMTPQLNQQSHISSIDQTYDSGNN